MLDFSLIVDFSLILDGEIAVRSRSPGRKLLLYFL